MLQRGRSVHLSFHHTCQHPRGRLARLRTFARQSIVRVFTFLLALSLSTTAWASEASDLYKKGRQAQKAGKIAQAYLLYSEAAALEPSNHLYWLRAESLKTRAALEAKVAPKVAAALPQTGAGPVSDESALELATPQDLDEARKPQPPATLSAPPVRKDFSLRGDAKTLFESVARAYGLDCVFDGDYQPAKTVRFQMDQADYREALHALEAVTGSFIVPISERLFLVVKDTPEKRREEEPFAAAIVPLPEPTSTQDLTSLITAVQQASGIQKIAWDSQKNIVVMRDVASKIIPAKQMFQDLLYPRAQILFEMEFLEVSRTDLVKYGLGLPNSFPLVSFSDFLHSAPQIASNLAGMLLFGGGESLLGLGIANAQLVASLTRSSGSVLLQSTARSIDGQPATLHIGQRYPILTAGYFGPSNFNGPGAYTPPPSFNFEDLGLAIKATPHVHGTEEVTLSLEAEFKVLSGAAANGIPIISNRALKSDVRLKMGEWAAIAGLIQTQQARTIAGIAGLATLPVIGPLTSTNTRDKEDQEVIILLKPTLLTAPPDQSTTHIYRIGSETRPLTPI